MEPRATPATGRVGSQSLVLHAIAGVGAINSRPGQSGDVAVFQRASIKRARQRIVESLARRVTRVTRFRSRRS
eukprot:7432290-Lingulodinium_polyedra.AAC.1